MNSGIFPKLLYEEDTEGWHKSTYFNRRLFRSPVGLGESAERQESTEAHLGDTDIGGSCSWELPTPHGHWWLQAPLWKPLQFFSIGPPGDSLSFFFSICLFWPYHVLVVELRIFSLVFVATCHQSTRSLSCSAWALVPWPGIEPRAPKLGAQSHSHWSTEEVPPGDFYSQVREPPAWVSKGLSLNK